MLQSGQLVYGAEAIPESWLERLAMHDFIGEMADALLNLCEHLSTHHRDTHHRDAHDFDPIP